MLIFQSLCLLFTLVVLQDYIASGIHSQSHRLLPLVLGLCALNNFYMVIFCVTGEPDIFFLLGKLLYVQLLYLLCCYVIDYLHLKPSKQDYWVFFFILILTDALAIGSGPGSRQSDMSMLVGSELFIVVLSVLIIYSYRHYSFSKRELTTTLFISLSILIPVLAIQICLIMNAGYEILLVIAIECSALIVEILQKKNRLVDTYSLLHERYFYSSEIPTLLYDEGKRFVDANQSARNLLGEQVEYSSYYHNRRKGDNPLLDFFQESKQSPILRVKDFLYRRDVHEIWEKDELKGYAIELVDITQEKVETARIEQEKRLAEQEKNKKSQIILRLSHFMRTPLYSIMGLCGILQERYTTEAEEKNLLEQIYQSGASLTDIVNGILDYSQMENGEFHLEEKPYSLRAFLEELRENAIYNLRDKTISITFRTATSFPRELIGDVQRLRTTFMELFGDFIPDMKEGSIVLTMYFDKIGERIYCAGLMDIQGDLSDNWNQDTSVINLITVLGEEQSLAQILVEKMQGKLWKDTDTDGLRFRFYFFQKEGKGGWEPPFSTSMEGTQKKEENEPERTSPSVIYPGARVLMVDDMAINREIFRMQTAPLQIQLDTAESGEEAIHAIHMQKYDLILLDYLMPGMNGDEAARIISGITDTPLVLISANIFSEKEEEYHKWGFQAFIKKPVEVEELFATMERLLPNHLKEVVLAGNRKQEELSESRRKSRLRVYDSFLREISAIGESLSDLFAQDMEVFRIKVHGIKGAARQVEQENLAFRAETLEMAAKTDNRPFIEKYLPVLQEEMEQALISISSSRNQLAETIKPESDKIQFEDLANEHQSLTNPEEARREIGILLESLATGFRKYDLIQIEKDYDELVQLCSQGLEDEDNLQELLKNIKQQVDDLEYEEGSRIIADFLTNWLT